jgi:hypothetical protein
MKQNYSPIFTEVVDLLWLIGISLFIAKSTNSAVAKL